MSSHNRDISQKASAPKVSDISTNSEGDIPTSSPKAFDKSHIRESIGGLFRRMSQRIYQHPKRALTLTLVLTLFFCSGLFKLYIDVSPESMLGENNAARADYDKFRSIFESDEIVTIVLKTDDIFSPAFLKRLKKLHLDIESTIPYTSQIDSLVNARLTKAKGDDISVDSLLDEWPESRQDFLEFKQNILANPVFKNIFYTGDHRHTMLRINVQAPWTEEDANRGFTYDLLETDEVKEMVTPLRAIVFELQAEPGINAWLTGGPPNAWSITDTIERDMGLFTTLAIIMIGILLVVLFRRASGLFIPLAIVTLSIVATFGVMGLSNVPIAMISQILPTFLLAVGVGDAVHILSIFYREYDKGTDKETALISAYEHSGAAILMTSLTTAGGLFSFYFADIIPIEEFGLVAPVGVGMALLYTMLLIPVLVATMDIKRRNVLTTSTPDTDDGLLNLDGLDKLLVKISRYSHRNPKQVASIWIVLLLASIYGGSQLQFTYQPSRLMNESHMVRQAVDLTNEHFGWGTTIDIVVDTQEAHGLYKPENLKAIAKAQEITQQIDTAGLQSANTSSIADLVQELNKALHADKPSEYRIPDSKALVAQELLLFDLNNADDLKLLTNDNFRYAKITTLLPDKNQLKIKHYIDELNLQLADVFPSDTSYNITGIGVVSIEAFGKLLATFAKSYGIALLVIFPLMVLFIGRFQYALMSMIPNITPIVVGTGFMYLAGIPLNMFTILVGSIIIGIAVDDTIHFMHNYMRYREAGLPVNRAIEQTVLSAGRALLITSICLACGFSAFCLAEMPAVQYFGGITALTIGLAFIADLSLTPALVTLLNGLEKETESLLAPETEAIPIIDVP